MHEFPEKLQKKLAHRESYDLLRHLPECNGLIDFSSNDYLGLSRNREILERTSQLLTENNVSQNGATGSRLLSGNHPLYTKLEKKLADFHQTEATLVFNSGYDANIGFLGCVPQRGDIIFYDEYVHASIRDGIKMGNAKSYKFKHNDLEDLKKRCRAGGQRKLERGTPIDEVEVYIVTESVFSMDGDSPDLRAFAEFCGSNDFHLIVDEAHAVGVFGDEGGGLVQHLGLQDAVFARIVTFGKAMGCHGAAILGSGILKNYLVNFARSLIYTTGLPPHSVATILSAYEYLSESADDKGLTEKHPLSKKIRYFNLELKTLALSANEGLDLKPFFIPSTSAIHCCIVPGNERARAVAEKIREKGFDVRAILAPTVPEGRERIRICLHSYNSEREIHELLEILSQEIKIAP